MAAVWSLLVLATSCSGLVSALPTAAPIATNVANPTLAASRNLPLIIPLSFIGFVLLLYTIWMFPTFFRFLRRRHAERSESNKTPRVASKQIDEISPALCSEGTEPQPISFDERKSAFIAKPVDVRKFIEFLELYGEGGIFLRELLMLASIRYFRDIQSLRTTEPSSDGNVLLEKFQKDMTFLKSFALDATRPEGLVALRDGLVSLGRITVRENSSQATANHETWATDRQVWVARETREELDHQEEEEFHVDLIRIFNAIPDEGIMCTKKRRTELFYSHARLVGIYLSQKALRTPTRSIIGLGINEHSREQFIHLMMNLLTHRHLVGDGKVMEDLLSLLDNSDIDPMLHPRSYVMWQWAQMKQDFRPGMGTSSRVVEIIQNLEGSPQWSRGVTGFLLADSIQELENLQDLETLDQVLKLSDQWCNMAYQSRDHETMSALCILLPQLKLWDKLARMPGAYHLDCGFHLSRLGYPDLAERFLVSGFSACKSRILGKYWRYQIELLAVIMRLGRWQEAEDKLKSSLQLAVKERHDATLGGDFDKWQLSGDLGEFELSINCLLADCSMAKGDFHRAELLLRSPLNSIQGMRDPYIKSMRVAVRSRSLHALRHLEDFPSAVTISLQQCRDLVEHDGSSLDKGTVRWMVDELLSCTNELVDAGMLSGAMEIIKTLATVGYEIRTVLPKETRDYIQRRRDTITHPRTAERPSLSSEQALADTIHTASRFPISEEGSLPNLFPTESLAIAAAAFTDVSVKKSPIWLQGNASESPEVAQEALAKRLQTVTSVEKPAKNPNKARKQFSIVGLPKKSLLRLPHLPVALKTKLSSSGSASIRSRPLDHSDTLENESMPSMPSIPLTPLVPLTPLIADEV